MLTLEHWPIERLIEYARNPRKNDHAVDKIAAAIREFGFRVPVCAKSDGTVVDGHLRLKAAKKLGLKEVPVVLADDMTETQIKAFRLSVNRMADLAEWDEDLLKLELQDLQSLDFDLALTGFDGGFLTGDLDELEIKSADSSEIKAEIIVSFNEQDRFDVINIVSSAIKKFDGAHVRCAGDE